MRTLAIVSLVFLLSLLTACGGGKSSSAPSSPLSGNWQINLSQRYPSPPVTLFASGFLAASSNSLEGTVQGPSVASSNGLLNCGGVGQLTGTISGQSVSFSLSPGGTVFNFTGTISSDNTSMSGTYEAAAGPCFTAQTTGTWTASLIPPLNGNFTGTLSGSGYMSTLTGVSPPAPIVVSGTMSQSEDFGASNATVTGTITATGYPCFVTASLTGTISGQNVILSVFGYNGLQIGTLSASASPATGSSGSLPSANGSLSLGKVTSTTTVGPCPPLNGGSGTQIGDTTTVALSFQ